MKALKITLILLFGFAQASVALAEGEVSPAPIQAYFSSPTAPSTAPTFAEVNSQIFQPICSSCHDSDANPDLTSFSTFGANTKWIVPGDPADSLIYQKVESEDMPMDGPPLTADQKALIFNWIKGGAANN